MGLFDNKNADLSPEKRNEQTLKTARLNILLVVALTALNVIFVLIGADNYFLFSAALPYYLVGTGTALVAGGASSVVLVLSIAFTVLILAAYVLCFLFGSKNIGWLIAALVMFAIDTVAFIAIFIFIYIPQAANGAGTLVSSLIDLLLHFYALYYFISAVTSTLRRNKFSQENAGGTPDESASAETIEQ